jgi:hypothetical protein
MGFDTEMRVVLLLVLSFGGLAVAASRQGERIRGVAMLAGWLLPGAGHALLGRWRKGLFFLGLLSATYLVGLWIVGFRPVSWDENPFYYIGQYGSGATFALARLLGPEKSFPRLDLPVSWYDPGLLYVCVAGLLNLVVVCSLIDHPVPSSAPGGGASEGKAAPAVPAPEKPAP